MDLVKINLSIYVNIHIYIYIYVYVYIYIYIYIYESFPGGSDGKESICNARNPDLIPGSGRFPGEGIGYPFQYSGTSFVAQIKNLPAMQETWVQPLGWEDPLEKGKATHSSILTWRIP